MGIRWVYRDEDLLAGRCDGTAQVLDFCTRMVTIVACIDGECGAASIAGPDIDHDLSEPVAARIASSGESLCPEVCLSGGRGGGNVGLADVADKRVRGYGPLGARRPRDRHLVGLGCIVVLGGHVRPDDGVSHRKVDLEFCREGVGIGQCGV